MSILIFIFAQWVNINVNIESMRTIFLFILFSSKLLFGQSNEKQEEYLKERGYVITPNTKIEIPVQSNTYPSYENHKLKQSDLSNTTNQGNNKNRINDSLKEEALKLSYADKKKIKEESVEKILGGLKEEKYNLTEYENQNIENENVQDSNNENTILYIIIAFLILILILVIIKSKKSNDKE